MFKGSRADLRKHMLEKQVEHTTMMKDKILSVETNVQRIQNTTTTVQQRQEALDNQANNYREELASFRDDLATLRAAVDRHQNRSHEIEESARPLPAGEPQGAEKPESSSDEMKEIKARLARVEEQVKQMLVRERQALGRGQVR